MKLFRPLPAASLLALLLACSSAPRHPSASDGKYDLAYPAYGSSESLGPMLQAVQLLSSSAKYTDYHFALGDSVQLHDISDEVLGQRQKAATVSAHSVVGTATVIYRQVDRIAVLTCAHVVDFPDTMVRYQISESGRYVRTFSVLLQQTHVLPSLPPGDGLEVLAMDRDADIAILGMKLPPGSDPLLPVFSGPLGRAADLDWGTFVFVAGFPTAKKMITTAAVSAPRRDRRNSFLLDMVFNRGFSGGVVFAVRDGLPNLELVGMVNAGAAESEIIVTPGFEEVDGFLDASIPYPREVYLERRKRLTYGISFGISTEHILLLLDREQASIESKGYSREKFFSAQDDGGG
ncbi:MAG: trypsin-like peptidase domain-containing protein [Gemmatimonadetes bacterium]|jgi:hypothetical protein|nr:trypsin-like peptidase domain-containing protein [Gemmatimonadota bacterium]MBT5057019.1 trypsin-like peptidase domain-containing protein [Gemmatimonadota bacterium]MBT5145812.1 trypsin-like peptidase domain-containing protein [Gemmatimonadota bacterium]MBT5587793.1 trypsin-like peptidase domain-containing protein [Gemmatimonadota bacterium]MBT5962395.1 trypsin-like peptidase domain-containing protein [Gemmatimonadota bacterium]